MKTLEQIRAALPTHIMLTPGVQKLKWYDELWAFEGFKKQWFAIDPATPERGWLEKANHRIYEIGEVIARRPIPPHILDNQAFYVWLSQIGLVTKTERDQLTREQWRTYHIAGRLYDKWLLEQMEGV